MFKKLLISSVLFCFFLTSLGPWASQADVLNLPVPGTMVNLSPSYDPVIIKGLTVHKDNPFLFDFIVDVGQDRMSGEPLKKEGEKLIKYFLAGLAIPDKDLWVNLSPYEKNRIVPEVLGQTDMGRDLLEQDYILKQITASLIYPEKRLGKVFWDKVYAQAQARYGSVQVPVNTFNKVWIMADKAEVFEHNQTAFVVGCHLKVMLEEDYLALKKHQKGVRHLFVTHSIASQVVREIVLPQLEKEVNQGRNFANLRQIFNSVILSSWYKHELKQALLNQVYANRSKVKGINLNDPSIKERIYEEYLKAYKKGVFNYIKEDINAAGQTIPHKYFSGGTIVAVHDTIIRDNAMGESLMAEDEAKGHWQDRLEEFDAAMDIRQEAQPGSFLAIDTDKEGRVTNLDQIVKAATDPKFDGYGLQHDARAYITSGWKGMDELRGLFREIEQNINEQREAWKPKFHPATESSRYYLDLFNGGSADLPDLIWPVYAQAWELKKKGQAFGIKYTGLNYPPRGTRSLKRLTAITFRTKFVAKTVGLGMPGFLVNRIMGEEKVEIVNKAMVTLNKGVGTVLEQLKLTEYKEVVQQTMAGAMDGGQFLINAAKLYEGKGKVAPTQLEAALKNGGILSKDGKTVSVELFDQNNRLSTVKSSLGVKDVYVPNLQKAAMDTMNVDKFLELFPAEHRDTVREAFVSNSGDNDIFAVFRPKAAVPESVSPPESAAPANAAMGHRPMALKHVQPYDGGIDLSTSRGMQWNIRKDGQGVEMPTMGGDPVMLARFRQYGITSLSPFIFKIIPIVNVWPMMGLHAPSRIRLP